LCSPSPPLRRLLENQLPITTRAERLRLAFTRRHNINCRTAAPCTTTLQHRRPAPAGCRGVRRLHVPRPWRVPRTVAGRDGTSRPMSRRSRGRGTAPAPSSPPRRSGSAARSRPRRGRKRRTGAPPSAGSAGCPSARGRCRHGLVAASPGDGAAAAQRLVLPSSATAIWCVTAMRERSSVRLLSCRRSFSHVTCICACIRCCFCAASRASASRASAARTRVRICAMSPPHPLEPQRVVHRQHRVEQRRRAVVVQRVDVVPQRAAVGAEPSHAVVGRQLLGSWSRCRPKGHQLSPSADSVTNRGHCRRMDKWLVESVM
jgi:hypothetical protein